MESEFPMTLAQSVNVNLVDETEHVIDRAFDPPGVWRRALQNTRGRGLDLLAQVDPYDDTYFKHGQLEELEREIAVLRSNSQGEDAIFFDRCLELITQARSAARLMIEFAGD